MGRLPHQGVRVHLDRAHGEKFDDCGDQIAAFRGSRACKAGAGIRRVLWRTLAKTRGPSSFPAVFVPDSLRHTVMKCAASFALFLGLTAMALGANSSIEFRGVMVGAGVTKLSLK